MGMHARTPLPVSRSRYGKGNSFEAAHAGTMPHGGEACNDYRRRPRRTAAERFDGRATIAHVRDACGFLRPISAVSINTNGAMSRAVSS
jgi:hypothetical protein